MADKEQIQGLRKTILHWLDDNILTKEEEARSKLEDLILQTGRAFADALYRYALSQNPGSEEIRAPGRAVTEVLRAYNEINRREVDIAAIEAIRKPVLKG